MIILIINETAIFVMGIYTKLNNEYIKANKIYDKNEKSLVIQWVEERILDVSLT